MNKGILLSTTLATLAALPVLAQDAGTNPGLPDTNQQYEVPLPPIAGPTTAPGDLLATPAVPPPRDAIIAEEDDDEILAEKLIGTEVYSTYGEAVGEVEDIIIDKDGKITGVVLSVGGWLGIGGKPVGIAWNEIYVSPDEESLKIEYTAAQLAVAPGFKTEEQQAAEEQVERLKQLEELANPPAQ